MDKVPMHHPDLPGQDIDVLPLAVEMHKESGWVEGAGVSHDDGSRQIAAQQSVTQQSAKPATTTTPKSGKDGAES